MPGAHVSLRNHCEICDKCT